MNAIATTEYRSQFRAAAADRMKAAADMTLHELLDEYIRLSRVMQENRVDQTSDDDDDWTPPKLNDAGEIAARERGVILGAANARFGVRFDTSENF